MNKILLSLMAFGLLFFAQCKSKVYTQEECESALTFTFSAIEEEAKSNPQAVPLVAGFQQQKQNLVDKCMEGKFDPTCLKNSPGLAGMMGCVKK